VIQATCETIFFCGSRANVITPKQIGTAYPIGGKREIWSGTSVGDDVKDSGISLT
jgi:hypothetical protein